MFGPPPIGHLLIWGERAKPLFHLDMRFILLILSPHQECRELNFCLLPFHLLFYIHFPRDTMPTPLGGIFFLFRPWVAYAPGIPCFLPLDDTHSKCSNTWKKNSWLARPLCACFWAREADLHSFQVDECGLSSTREWRWVAPHYLGICQFPAH